MELKKISDYVWEIPKQGKMNVVARVFASEKLLEKIKQDRTLIQLQNVACLPGIIKHALVMPDAHEGYGFPIGGVAAFDLETGIISPGGVGYDIGCGVRLVRTNWSVSDIETKKKAIIQECFKNVPCGVGKGGLTKLSKEQLAKVVEQGSDWAIVNGYGWKEDLKRTEEYGRMSKADFSAISDTAIKRGIPQLGTLGSGNHFLEIQKVDKIYNKEVAEKFGIAQENQITVMIHCGSRGFGHQVASDYIKFMEEKYGVSQLPDRELVNAPIQSELGQKYHRAMCGALNYAFANRQLILHWTRESFKKIMGSDDGMDLIYDVAHNLAKMEEHTIDGEKRTVCIHRKGATRSFGPGRQELPEIYRETGQPVIIPGSMGTASYLLVGTTKAEEVSFGSTAHGAGRVMSRSQAIRQYRGEEIKNSMAKRGIELMATSWKGVAEEAEQAYKDIDEVAKVSHNLNIGNLVARLVPIAVMKG